MLLLESPSYLKSHYHEAVADAGGGCYQVPYQCMHLATARQTGDLIRARHISPGIVQAR